MLDVPTRKRWKNEATLSDCDHTYVGGTRLDEAVLDKNGPPKSVSRASSSSQHTQPPQVSIPLPAGSSLDVFVQRKYSRSLWSGREGTVNVEQLAIEYYESLGYRA